MKKHVLLSFALLIGLIANAQLTDAILYHKNNQLPKAKEAIEKASKNEKVARKSKVWYYRGLINMDLAKGSEEATKKYELFNTANESFAKAITTNAGETWVSQSKGKVNELYSVIFNEGVGYHNAKDFENALKFDELAAMVEVKEVKNRVNALINATIAASELGLDDKRIELNKKILEIQPNDPEAYVELILLYDKKEDLDQALKYAEEGAKKFPKDNRFTNEEARLAIKSGKGDEAIAKLKAASEKEPENTIFLNKIADIYDQQGDKESAEKYYNKTLAIDANNIDANYNLGSLYFNKGATVQNEVNKMDLKDYQKMGAAKEKRGKILF